jgi:hypothetical protein
MTKISRLVLIGAAASLLTGCTIFESPADRATRATPNYQAGYSDGCATANNQGASMGGDSTVRDEDLFRSDKAYSAGWSTGFSACRSTDPTRGGASAPGSGPIPESNPGGGGLPL